MAKQLGFYINADNCIGCKACVAACKDKNDLPLGEKMRRVFEYAGCDWDVSETGACMPSNFFAYSISIACNHCAEPACVASCPVGAMTKREEDGIVYVDKELCIGCGTCAQVCPYGAPYLGVDDLSCKCDFCMDLIDEGKTPYCVAICPTRCLEFGDIEELRAKYGNVDGIEPIPMNTGTMPSLVIGTNRLNPDGSIPGTLITTEQELVSEAV
ncbi:MAG: 4Fe-4S binding protein [Coriobacteriales bacterium]|nr:4Fe-4S binding protein [Coriobacteriales bacterium]